MKNYTITVNGNVYDVTVEEGAGVAMPAAAPKAAPVSTPKAAPAPAASGAAGSIKVTSPMQGKILGVKVNVGDSVKKGQVVAILEAMKMENEVVSTKAGTVAQIVTSKGAVVETGSPLVVIA